MVTPTVYVICGNNCKYEGMTKEQILTAIMQAVNEGTISNIDTGFITTVKTINDKPLKFFVGTQAEYDALTNEQRENLFAIITNDTAKQGLAEALTQLSQDIEDANTALEEIGKSYAKRSSAYTEIGKADTGYPIYSFDIGTILTYRVLYSSLIRIGDIIDGSKVGNIAVHSDGATHAFIYSPSIDIGSFADVIGKWRVCGMCGSTTINSQTYNYWIIQRIE